MTIRSRVAACACQKQEVVRKEETVSAGKEGEDAITIPSDWLDDIIASKAATHRKKDLESLPRLRAFREYWIQRQ